MHLSFLLLLMAFDWSSLRGNPEGTQQAEGTGTISATSGEYPVLSWSYEYSGTGFSSGDSLVGDFEGDGGPEVIGLSRSRVYLWDDDGTVLASSDSIASPEMHGLYDLDGDGDDELVVTGSVVGGGVHVFDPGTLALLWRSGDFGYNGGAAFIETVVVDADGDGASEIIWNSFQGFTTFHLASFADGDFSAPAIVTVELPPAYNNMLPPVAGNYLGGPGGPTGGFAVEQGRSVTFFGTTDASDPEASCSDDLSWCLAVEGEFEGVHAWLNLGDWASFDADGDGDDEFISSSAVAYYNADITVLDPSAGLSSGSAVTEDGLLWQYRYGLNQSTYTYLFAGTVRDLRSTTGETIVAVGVYDAGVDETDHDGDPADDCLENPLAWGTVVFDAQQGLPLAVVEDAYPAGSLDTDGDGRPEIVLVDGIGGTVSGSELVCGGLSHAAGWSSCASTGCSLVEQWSVEGYVEWPRGRADDPTFSSFSFESRSISLIDLDGDGVDEVLVTDGGDLVAWQISAVGIASEYARYTLGSCGDLNSVGSDGTDTWLLLEGGECFTVLDADLTEVASFSVAERQGASRALTGDVGGSGRAPVLAIGTKLYFDPAVAPSTYDHNFDPYIPALFADFDGDGIDEVVVYSSYGDWKVAVYRWTGSSYVEDWSVLASDLGASATAISLGTGSFVAGDYDGDGDPDLAFFAADSGGTGNSTLFFADGQGDGAGGILLLGRHLAPVYGADSLRGSQLIAADVCDGTSCPGTDGIDELIFPDSASFEVYSCCTGLLESWSAASASTEAVVDDFDGDGDLEMGGVTNWADIGGMFAMVYELDGTRTWRVALDSGDDVLQALATADADADGAADLIVGGGYGEITAYSGLDGSVIPGYPLYLAAGEGSAAAATGARRVLQTITADIDGDGFVEALVAHDDGYLYAVDLSLDEGGPAVLWTYYLGAPVTYVRAADLDGDNELEVLALPYDGHAYVIDSGAAEVTIDTPASGACVTDTGFDVQGSATAVTAVQVLINGVLQATATVSAGSWDAGSFTFASEGAFRVEAYGVYGSDVASNDSVVVTHWEDGDGDGFSECDDDCDDSDPVVYAAATELCDGFDQDCDGLTTDEEDDDGDGFRVCNGDCDDGDAAVHPAATELCNGLDDNCDGTVDEDSAADALTWYADADADGFGEAASPTSACTQPSGFVADDTDCDDGAAAINPAATELCNGLDDNCDGSIDEDSAADAPTWYADTDADGYGDAASPTVACDAPAGHVADDSDCDDGDASVYPSALEICDGLDQDCDGLTTDEEDADGDGFRVCEGDCDDSADSSNPTGTEIAHDGIDQDCSGADLLDADGDGYDADFAGGGDCHDGDPAVSPAGSEASGTTGVDDDCDGTVDEGTAAFDDDGDGYTEVGGDCDDAAADTHPGAAEASDGLDNDCDGAIDEGTSAADDDGDGTTETGGDCNDEDAAVFPGAPELTDGIDNDCDGAVDEGTADFDDDGDGVTENGGDCDDGDSEVHPGAAEAANGADDDCDGTTDEGTVDYDDDGDGITENGGDCDDSDDAVHPGAAEWANGIDDDCDGVVDEDSDTADDDDDGLSEAEGDCDDADAATFPGATEEADGLDNDCDGRVDDGTEVFDDDGDGSSEAEGDCDDSSLAVGPGQVDLCLGGEGNGIDEDCDGVVDEDCEGLQSPTGDGCGGCATAAERPGGLLFLLLAGLAGLRRRRGSRTGLAGLGAMLLLGCGQDYELQPPRPGDVQVSPGWLDYGQVTLGREVEAEVELRNVSERVVEFTRVQLEPEGVPFELLTDPADLGIAGADDGSDYQTLTLAFTPTAAELSEATLTLDVAHATQIVLSVALFGKGAEVQATFVPLVLDFGSVLHEETATVTLLNQGLATVRIDAITLPAAAFEVVADLEGAELAPGGVLEVQVTVASSDALDDLLTVEFEEGTAVALALRANDCAGEAATVDDADSDGFTWCGGDCDDGNDAIRPGAVELSDGRDNDCDGTVDEGTEAFDDDGDGYSEEGGDCNDDDAAVFPGSTAEHAGVDHDCDGVLVGNDGDGDGYSAEAGDCDDADASVRPGQPELADGFDQDCDGAVDEGTSSFDDDGDRVSEADGDCHDGDAAIAPGAAESANGIDDDCNGAVDEGTDACDDDGDGTTESGGDCDDANAEVRPGAADEEGDGVDSDCDGSDD